MFFSALLQSTPILRVSIFAFALLASASQNVPSSSPAASTELICHTENPADCYPAVFSPTRHFQVVHDDQSIPPGLHVRMNIATGVKEARLNIPEPGRDDEAAVVVIEEEGLVESPELNKQIEPSKDQHVLQAQQQHQSDEHSSTGFPHTTSESDRDMITMMARVSSAFEGKGSTALPQDLEDLVELAYDVEFGATMMSDRRFTRALLDRIQKHTDEQEESDVHSAIDILGVSLHNNPAALKALMANEGHRGQSPAVIAMKRLRDIFPSGYGQVLGGPDVHRANRLIFFLSQICQDDYEFDNFLAQDGLSLLNVWLKVESTEGGEHERTRLRVRIANFVADLAPGMSRNMSRVEDDMSAIRKLCQSLKLDPSVRYDTSSVQYTSAVAAVEALSAVLGGDCDS